MDIMLIKKTKHDIVKAVESPESKIEILDKEIAKFVTENNKTKIKTSS